MFGIQVYRKQKEKKITLNLNAVGGWLLMVTAITVQMCKLPRDKESFNPLNHATDLICPKFKYEIENPPT